MDCTPAKACNPKTEFCCPDAKHCLTLTDAGNFCDSDKDCAKTMDAICCPLIKQCVTAGYSGAACVATAAPAFMQL